MAKIFLKTFFTLFLAFILFVNMAYAFDLVGVFGYSPNLAPGYSYEGYYFGFRNFLDFISDFDNSNYITGLKSANSTYLTLLDDISRLIFDLYAGALPSLQSSAGFFKTVAAIASHLSLFVLGTIYPIWFIIYNLCIVGYIVVHFFISIFGYYTPLPNIYPV